MKTTLLIGALAGSLALVANAKTHLCNASKPNCPVTITINGDGNSCSVDVADEIHVKKKHKPVIHWRINNTGSVKYVFNPGGIQFNDKAGPVLAGEFKDLGVHGGGTGYRMQDLHSQPPASSTTPRNHSYKITTNPPSGKPCEVDPIVANE